MTPEELLRRYPRETLRWLRGRLGLTRETFADGLGVAAGTIQKWEVGRPIGAETRRRLAIVLERHLATPEGAAFARSRGASDGLDPGGLASLTTRAGLRGLWQAAGRGWDAAPAEHRGRNLAIARAYLETDEPLAAIAARHGVSRTRVPAVARTVVYHMLGRRPPTR